VTGVVYVIAGPCLIVNRRARAAALAVGVMLLVLIFAVYLPMLVAAPLDIANAINYLFDTLLVCGSALAVAKIQGGATTSPFAVEALHA
jgi:succinate-acetate transporter protein